jgi:glycosyltransferase involved in cell wall biosynthesis
MERIDLSGRTILYLVTEDWYFWSHRLAVARAARHAGARIVVAARLADHRARIEREGFVATDIPFDRSGLNPRRDRATVEAILAAYRAHRPDLAHHIAMKPVLYGSYAARRAGVSTVVNAMAGLGFLFVSRGAAGRVLRPFVKLALRRACDRDGTLVIVQNDDDRTVFAHEIGVAPARIAVVRGSGVDIAAFAPTPEPPGPPVALFVGRLLRDKGVAELVEAARLLRQRGVGLTVRLVGGTDANPASIPEATLGAWRREGVVELPGPSADVAAEYARAHIAVLLSYREGLPKALLEGAACARPVVATDVPGCREICRDGETGLLVPARSVKPAADALARLASNPVLRARMGAAARALVEREFADDRVCGETLALYARLLGDQPARAEAPATAAS